MHQIEKIFWGSRAYGDSLRLRDEILRKPIGLELANDLDREAEKDQVHVACLLEKRVVGCALGVEREPGVWQIRQMAVAPEMQGKGIGSAIVRHLEGLLHHRGASRLFLHARAPVVGFYHTLGYTESGPLFLEVGIPHQKMVKEVR